MRKDLAATPDTHDAEPEGFKALTPQEAMAWRERQAPVSVWRVVVWQAVAVCAVGGLGWWVTSTPSLVASLVYGGACACLPAVVMARGVTMGRVGWLARWVPRGSLGALVFWEAVKIGLTVLMLVSAPRVIKDLNWLALLAGFVVVLKIYWLAFLMLSRGKKQSVVT